VGVCAVAAFLVAHALVHLSILPGGVPAYGGGTLGWSGGSLLDGLLPHAVVVVVAWSLLSATLVASAVAAWLLVVRRYGQASIAVLVANGCSLALFALIWRGLTPDASTFWRGLALSAALCAVALGAVAARRLTRQRSARTSGAV
jgi:Kef-type K+ transport system membrane component KefB